MGWSVETTGRTNLWHFYASLEGWLASKGVEPKPPAMDLGELDDLIKRTS